MGNIRITWYGHCAFLITLGKTKILTDPYDHFNNIRIGEIEADHLILSSVAHDHGNIAASVNSWTHNHEGVFDLTEEIKLTGVKTKEYRGTPNTIFNFHYKDFSITNFADLGDPESLNDISESEKNVLKTTNIALMRHNPTLDPEVHSYDLSLKLCDPNIIIPIHFFPKSFVKNEIPPKKQKGYLHKFKLIDEMFKKLPDHKVKNIDSYKTELGSEGLKERQILFFQQIHPQVKYHT
jgi:hypothetical protein